MSALECHITSRFRFLHSATSRKISDIYWESEIVSLLIVYLSSREFTTRDFAMDYSCVEQFLDSNGVTEGWKRLILENGDLKVSLKGIILDLGLTRSNAKKGYSPAADQMPRAFAYC